MEVLTVDGDFLDLSDQAQYSLEDKDLKKIVKREGTLSVLMAIFCLLTFRVQLSGFYTAPFLMLFHFVVK